jgi:DNA polymerase-3 subunit gamma/tau
MRDALSLLETCISHGNNITGAVVREAAGVAGGEHVFGISEAVLSENPASALKIINALHEQSKDMGRFLGELIAHYRNLMLLKLMPNETSLVSWLPEEADDYRKLAEKYELSGIMRALNTLEEYFERMSRSRDKRLAAELCLIEMCSVGENVGARIARPEQPEMPQIPQPPPAPPLTDAQCAPLQPEPVVLAEGWGGILQPDKITEFKNKLKQKGIEVKER